MTLDDAKQAAAVAWANFGQVYSRIGNMPEIKFNNRLKVTAGYCKYTERVIELSPIMYRENMEEFHNVIIPHELAHQIAWDKFKDPGHGKSWKSVMVAYGLPPNCYHNMTSSAMSETQVSRITAAVIPKTISTVPYKVNDLVTFIHRNRQRQETVIKGYVSKVNVKTIKMVDSKTYMEWTVPVACESLKLA